MYSEDDDQEQKIALTVVFGIVSSILIGVIAFAVMGSKPSTNEVAETSTITTNKAATAASIANLKDDESAFIVENGMVKFYFASGKSDLATGGKETLVEVVKGIQAGQKASISGYHDSTGDPIKNEELAKKRAMSVYDTLIALGVTQDKLELKKPEQAQGTGNNTEARRVEVILIK